MSLEQDRILEEARLLLRRFRVRAGLESDLALTRCSRRLFRPVRVAPFDLRLRLKAW
jgi:hypothetical protein